MNFQVRAAVVTIVVQSDVLASHHMSCPANVEVAVHVGNQTAKAVADIREIASIVQHNAFGSGRSLAACP